MRPVKISNRLSSALINTLATSSLSTIAATRLLLAREIREAKRTLGLAHARSVSAWAAWIGYPTLLHTDRIILRDLGAEAIEANAPGNAGWSLVTPHSEDARGGCK